MTEFTCDQLMALYERAKVHQDLKLLDIVGKEMERRLTPQVPEPKTISTKFFDTEHSRYAKDCTVTVPDGWHIIKEAGEIKWTDKDMIDFALWRNSNPISDTGDALAVWRNNK